MKDHIVVSRVPRGWIPLRDDVRCRQAEASFFQDLQGRHQRVKAYDKASAKLNICRFIEVKQVTMNTS
jgi:hypothetical protein